MKITNLSELANFVEELNFQNYPNSEKIKICFSDRFNEFVIDTDITITETAEGKVITIPCEKVGSALQGTHRVFGSNRE